MKKKYLMIIGILITVLVVSQFINPKSITFPFLVTDVVQVEMYHYEGVPAAEECKIITQREDIETLYNDLQKIKLRTIKENPEPMTGGSAIRFEFVLEDNSIYVVESSNGGGCQTVCLQQENVEYITSANVEKYWNQFSYKIIEKQEKETDLLSIEEYNEKYASKQPVSMVVVYKEALYRIRNKHIFPDGVNYGYDDFYDISENHFAIYDVDVDGKDELLISYWTTSMAGNVFKIYGYDEISGNLQEEFSEYLGVTIYSNGIIEAKKSHNHGLASMSEEFWPYALYQYDSENDCYIKIADVDAWEQAYRSEYDGIEFPEEADADGDGLLYYIMTNDTYEYQDPIDTDAYEKWRDSYLAEAEVIQIPLLRMTEENIENI